MVGIGVLDSMAPSTPSPPITAASSNGSATTTSTSRRPARKSTLTQQQKNQKRQRATQDQLITLEIEFNKNPTPTAAVRERIAQDISMTERSVQIWFQNRSEKSCRVEKATADLEITGVQRSSCWPRRASKQAKTATPSLSRCEPILPCKSFRMANPAPESSTDRLVVYQVL